MTARKGIAVKRIPESDEHLRIAVGHAMGLPAHKYLSWPNWPCDLNACRDMYLWGVENYGDRSPRASKGDRALAFRVRFSLALSRIVKNADTPEAIVDADTINASGRQRCQAFLVAMGWSLR